MNNEKELIRNVQEAFDNLNGHLPISSTINCTTRDGEKYKYIRNEDECMQIFKIYIDSDGIEHKIDMKSYEKYNEAYTELTSENNDIKMECIFANGYSIKSNSIKYSHNRFIEIYKDNECIATLTYIPKKHKYKCTIHNTNKILYVPVDSITF